MEEADWATELIALYKEQMTHGAEIVALTDLFFKDEIEYDEEANAVLAGESVPAVLAAFKQELEAIEAFTPEAIKAATKATQKSDGAKKGRTYSCRFESRRLDRRMAQSFQTPSP